MAFVLSVCLVVCAYVLCDTYLIPPIALELYRNVSVD